MRLRAEEPKSVYADNKHWYPLELLCNNCEKWQPAYPVCHVEYPCCTIHVGYIVCSVCGDEVEDGEIQCIDVDEVLGYKALYEAQKEDIKFYREERNA